MIQSYTVVVLYIIPYPHSIFIERSKCHTSHYGEWSQGSGGSHAVRNQVHGQPVYGGANDPRLGNIHDKSDPGYFGHLELASPVYHQGFFDVILKSLRCICFHCSRIRMESDEFKFQKCLQIKSRKRRLEAFHDLLAK